MSLTATGRAAIGLALSSALFAPCARAQPTVSCVSPELKVELPLGAKWQTAVEQLSAHLRGRSDLDRCARVTVRPTTTGAVLEIGTQGGRHASRRVSSVAELVRAAEALLVLPPRPPTPLPIPSRVPARELPPPDVSPPLPVSSSIHVEFGAGAALRFGGGPTFAAGGVVAFGELELDRWLLALNARYEITTALLNQPTTSDFVMQTAALGVSVGRRLTLDKLLVDGLFGPSLILVKETADDIERDVAGSTTDLRLGGALSISGPRSASVRAFASANFEASPARLRSSKALDRALPQLPWWGSGIAVGVLWGMP